MYVDIFYPGNAGRTASTSINSFQTLYNRRFQNGIGEILFTYLTWWMNFFEKFRLWIQPIKTQIFFY